MPDTNDLEKALRQLLLSHPEIASLCEDRVGPAPLDQKSAVPAISFELLTGNVVRGLAGPAALEHPLYQFDCWVDKADYAKLGLLARAVKDILDGFAGTIDGVTFQNITCEDETVINEDAAKRRRYSLDFEIWYETRS